MGDESNKLLNVLLADDDRDDRFFFSQAISELDVPVNLDVVKDGEELMVWLQQRVNNLPDLLFLDLNMPRKNGFQCLEEIRKHEQLKNIFVAIYSTSSRPVDIEESYQKGANLFINKPNMYGDIKPILNKVFGLDRENYFPAPQMEKFVLTAETDNPRTWLM